MSRAIKKPLVWIIILIAIIARLGYVLIIPQYPVAGSGSDASEYNYLSQKILNGQFMPVNKLSTGDIEIARPPGYPLFLTLAYLTFGNNLTSARIFQAILAGFTTLFVFLLGRDIFNSDKIGYVSAFCYAVYPALLIYTGLLYTEAVFTSILVINMYILHLAIKQKKAGFFILTGAFLGITSLVSSRSMFFPVMMLFGFLFIFKRKARAFQGVFYIVIAMVLVISPWTIRNYYVSEGKFIFLENFNQSGTSLWWALNPDGLVDWSDYYDEQGTLRKPFDNLPVQERTAAMRKEAIIFLKKYPYNFIKYSPKRFFLLWFSGHSYYIGGLEKSLKSTWNDKQYTKAALKALLLLTNLFFIFLGFLGICLNLKKLKETFPLWLPILYFTALHSFYVTAARAQIPMLPFMLIYSSFTIIFIKDKLKNLPQKNMIRAEASTGSE